MSFFRHDFQIDGSFHERSQPVVETLTSSPAIGRTTTLVMAVACGVAATAVYCNQPMLGILETAFPGRASMAGLVPMATRALMSYVRKIFNNSRCCLETEAPSYSGPAYFPAVCGNIAFTIFSRETSTVPSICRKIAASRKSFSTPKSSIIPLPPCSSTQC